jgi:hypothetical protein
MASNPIQPISPMSYENRIDTTRASEVRQTAEQTRNLQEGNVTAPERVSADVKKQSIDARKREPKQHRQQQLDRRA